MSDNTIYQLNEVAKLALQLEGRQDVLPSPVAPSSWNLTTEVATAYAKTTGLNTTFRINSGSTIYARGFNHGGGQFSIATLNYYRSTTPTGSEVYVTPFTVNQTTGAITIGTPAQVVLDSSTTSNISTSQWGHAGSYAFYFGIIGQTTRVAAWTVSGNAVSGIQSVITGTESPRAGYWADNSNEDAATTRTGNTAYFAPGARWYTAGQLLTAYDYVWTYNGSSLTNSRNNALSSTFSQWHYTVPVNQQFGKTFHTGGSLRHYTTLATGATTIGRPLIQTLDSTLTPVNTYEANTLFAGSPPGLMEAVTAFELSNGKIMHQWRQEVLIQDTDNTLTRITNSMDGKLFMPGMRSRVAIVKAAAVDTWWMYNVVGPVMMVKIYINPTTYEVTQLASFNINSNWITANRGQAAYTTGAAFVTGTNNEFYTSVIQGESAQNTSQRFKTIRHRAVDR